MSDSTYTTLFEILRDDLALDPTRLREDAALRDDLGFDSVAFAIGVVAIQERFGVAVPERRLIDCQTVADVARMIDSERKAHP